VDLTESVVGTTDTLDGLTTGVIFINVSDQANDYIVGEMETCTTCDSTLIVSCSQ
jgi:hypothetical protein